MKLDAIARKGLSGKWLQIAAGVIVLMVMAAESWAASGYVVQQDEAVFPTADTVMDVTISEVGALDRAFVLLHYFYGQDGNANHNSNKGMVSAFLADTTTLRLRRYTSGTACKVSWTVIECLGEEFKVYRGWQGWSGSTTSYTPDIGGTVDGDKCFAWVNGTTCDYAGTDKVNDAHWIAYVDSGSQTTVNLERYATGSTSGFLRWIVVEFDTDKIGGIDSGQITTLVDQTSASPVTFPITGCTKSQSILLGQQKVDGANGIAAHSACLRIASDSVGEAYTAGTNGASKVVQWYCIDFGSDVGSRQEGSLTGDAPFAQTLSPPIPVDRGVSFVTVATTGGGTAFPRPMCRHWLSDSNTLSIAKEYLGNTDVYPLVWEWQVLELPEAVYVVAGLPSWDTDHTVASIETNEATASCTLLDENGDVTVFWGTVDATTNFTWAYTNSLGPKTTNVVDNPITATLSNLVADTRYYYIFYASNTTTHLDNWSTVGVSFGSKFSTGQTVGDLSATGVSPAGIDLAWTGSFGSETAYIIERSNAVSGGWVSLATIGADSASYEDRAGLSPDTTYYYRIAATNEAGLSAWSAEASATTWALTNGLVGYWPLDNTQLTELTDHTSTTNHGSFVSGSPTWVAGKFGNAMEVYATTLDRATIPHHASYNANNTYSISFWYYPIDGYRDRHQFSKGEGKVDIWSDNHDLQWKSFGWPWTATNVGFRDDVRQWRHFVVIYDPYAADPNEAKRVYVEGTLLAATSTVGIATDGALNTDPIGFSSSDNTRKSSGRYDDVAIWDRALTMNEIAYLYNGGTGNIVADLNVAPTPPTNVAATASDQLAILSWAANTVDPDAYAYNVHRGTSPGGPYTWVGTNVTDTSYTDTGLVNGTPYYYVIRSVDLRLAESADSAEVSVTPVGDATPPAVPSGLAAVSGYTRVYLSWAANAEPDFAGYNVYRSMSGGGPFTLQQALVTSLTWTQDGLTNGITYYYRITSEDSAGNESAPTAVVSATPDAFQDTAPGLVGYWPLDSTSGTNLFDVSETRNHGYFVSGTPYWTAGKLGNALALDNDGGAADELAQIPHHAAYITNDTFTISFWHQPITGYRKGEQFKKSDDLRMGHENWDAKWQTFGTAPWGIVDLGYRLDDKGWHHIVLVYDPSVTYGKRVYVDGALVGSNTAAAGGLDTALNTAPIQLSAYGADASCANRFDDIAIWDLPLTIDQIESLWNEGDGRPAYTPPPAGTVFRFR